MPTVVWARQISVYETDKEKVNETDKEYIIDQVSLPILDTTTPFAPDIDTTSPFRPLLHTLSVKHAST